MLNIAISVTFKLIILIMLLYVLAYIVDLIYFDVYRYPKILKEGEKKQKLLEDEIFEIIDINVAELLTYIVNDISDLNERLKACEQMLYLDDESFKNL